MTASSARRRLGFTLIELIGVLAIISILAAVITPNVMRATQRAALDAEAKNLRAIATYIESFTEEKHVVPTAPPNPYPYPNDPDYIPTWTGQVLPFAVTSETGVLWNNRGSHRRYLVDLSTSRALLISSMSRDHPLPAAIVFDDVWNTSDGQMPDSFATQWGQLEEADFLLVQRINLRPVFRSFTVSLKNISSASGPTGAPSDKEKGNNDVGGGADKKEDTQETAAPTGGLGPKTASFGYMHDGKMEVVTLSPTDGPELVELRPNAVLELYSDDQGKILQFMYVVSTTGKTFVFTNEHIWLPQ